ncbi:MAG: InlB B-repeat-containing protein [Eubacterium sp.]|nr:InlB B-repeat-containing protein [Eubacterium sp.]
MNTLVDKNVLNSLLNENQFRKEFKAMLNELIDGELKKDIDEMDCDLIDECTDMLIELEQQSDKGFPVLVPLTTGKKIINACSNRNFKSLSRGMRASIIACIILLSAISCNAAVYKISGHNIAKEVVETINQKLSDWGIVATAESDDQPYEEVTLKHGIEDIDGGWDEEETTAKPSTTEENKVEKTTKKPVGIEDIDGGWDDDETTTKKTGIEDIDGGWEDDETTTKGGIEDIDGGWEDDETTTEPTTKPIKPSTKQFTVTFDTDGGVCDIETKRVEFRKPVGALPVPTKPGYVFAGWFNIDIAYKYKSQLGGVINIKEEIPITPEHIYSLEKDAVFTAHWVEAIAVHFDANGGECDVDTLYTDGNGNIKDIPVPVREGYIFTGWTCKVKSGSIGPIPTYKTIKLTPNLIITESMTFKANWVEDKEEYTVTMDANGGNSDIESMTFIYGEPVGELPVPARAGYTFIGWFDKSSLPANEYTDETVFEDRNLRRLYALWAQDEYIMKFDPNGGECEIESMPVYYGQNYGELPVPTKPGYQFNGWYYNDTKINSSSSVPDFGETRERTVTAQWTKIFINITFDGNGGTSNAAPRNYSYGEAYTKLPTAYLNGYKFLGWFTEPEGGEEITVDSVVMFPYEGILYAHWEEFCENQIVVTVHTNRSIDSVYDLTYNYGDTLGSLEIPARTTSTEQFTEFVGWFDDALYGNQLSEDTVLTESMDVYAHWELSGLLRTTITIYNIKDYYDLGEAFNYDEIEVKGSTFAAEIPFQKMIDQEGAENFFFGIDTSTPGWHTGKFWMSIKELDYIALGTISFEKEFRYFVTGCEHSEGTHIENYLNPTCTSDGYTGDTVCNDCGAVLEHGEKLARLNHAKTEIRNAKPATCGAEGYTGDVYCVYCDSRRSTGKSIAKLPHANIQLVGVKAATCGDEGYTGDETCIDCGTVITKGKSIAKLPHGKTEIRNACKPTCGSFGNTGDEVCIECGTIVKNGTLISRLPHANPVIVNAREATCTEDGYTGDIYCDVCNTIEYKGEIIEKTGHSEKVIIEKASMGKDGHIGKICTNCGEMTDGSYYPGIASVELSETEYTYNNRPFTPTVIVKTADGDIIGTQYYDVEMPAGRTEVGTYTVKVKFKNYYEGVFNLTFNIKERTAGGIISATKVSRGIKAEWQAVEGADGYQLQVVSGDIVLKDLTFGANVTSQTIYMNTTNNTYLIIRSYKTEVINGVETKVYTDWSDKFYVG